MFEYSLGKVSSNTLDDDDPRLPLFKAWIGKTIEISSAAFDQRILKKRSLGFLGAIQGSGGLSMGGRVTSGDLHRRLQESNRGAMLLRAPSGPARHHVTCRVGASRAAVVLFVHDPCAHGEPMLYVPLHLSLGCWRMEWDECGILTEETAMHLLSAFLREAEAAADLLAKVG